MTHCMYVYLIIPKTIQSTYTLLVESIIRINPHQGWPVPRWSIGTGKASQMHFEDSSRQERCTVIRPFGPLYTMSSGILSIIRR